MNTAHTQIATWFVADDASNATFFPQVGAMSSEPEVQAIYWRCTMVFFATSLARNPSAPHTLFCNVQPPVVDGLDCAQTLRDWGVAIVILPLARRLPQGEVGSWGNQFYVFDVLQYFVEHMPDEQLILLDSDCVWMKPVDALAAAIEQHGAATYELGFDEHPRDEAINGLSRQAMARFAARQGPQLHGATGDIGSLVPYCGGEIMAVSRSTAERILVAEQSLWPDIAAGKTDAPREEAHLLSVIYALLGIAFGTANPFIRRMWTTLRHTDLRESDQRLAIWHMPAEKRSGFAALFATIAQHCSGNPREGLGKVGLDEITLRRALGFPRRGPTKLASDIARKLREKLAS